MLTFSLIALLIQALIPAGWMLSASRATVIEVTICSEGTLGAHKLRPPVPREEPPQDVHDPVQSTGRCTYSILSAAVIVDEAPVISALRVIACLLLSAPSLQISVLPIAYLRPPLRGPPAGAHGTTHTGSTG